MKKMKLFSMGTPLLFVCLILFTQYQYHTMSYTFIEETGDVSALQDVELQTGLSYLSNRLFDIEIKNGNISYQLNRYEQNQHEDILVDSSAHTKQIRSQERRVDSYQGGGTSCSNAGECVQTICEINVFRQDEGELFLTIQPNLNGLEGKPKEVDTSIKLRASENRDILYDQPICDPPKTDGSEYGQEYERIEPSLPHHLVKEDTGYYLMMNIDPYMEGMMDIFAFQIQTGEYDASIADMKHVYEFPVSYGSTGFLTTYEDQNYVFLWKEEQLKVWIFDKTMALIDTIETSIPIDSMEAMSFYQNDQYLLIKQGNTIVCYDFTEKKIIDTMTITDSSLMLHDLLYQNGRFYVSSQQEAFDTADAAVFARQDDLHIQIYEHNSLIYQGTLSLYDQLCEHNGTGENTCENVPMLLYTNDTLTFVRDAS